MKIERISAYKDRVFPCKRQDAKLRVSIKLDSRYSAIHSFLYSLLYLQIRSRLVNENSWIEDNIFMI